MNLKKATFSADYAGQECLRDEIGRIIYCDNSGCAAAATQVVHVSTDSAHDDLRAYCDSCANVYYVGVQHGRWHEAVCRGGVPNRRDSQTKPHKQRKSR